MTRQPPKPGPRDIWAIVWPAALICAVAIGAGIAFPGSRIPRVEPTAAPVEQDQPAWAWGGQRDAG